MRTYLVVPAATLATLAALAAHAAAQGAPGACDTCATPPPSPLAPPAEVDLTDRLGVGLHLVGLALADGARPAADPTQLGGGGLQVRYRASRRWELQLDAATVRAQDDQGAPVGPDVHVATLGVLFHVRPAHHWDWYLSGALGGLHLGAAHDAAHPTRGLGALGVGLEHRWQHLAIGAELRAIAIAHPPAQAGASTARTAEPAAADAGAAFALTATYYF